VFFIYSFASINFHANVTDTKFLRQTFSDNAGVMSLSAILRKVLDIKGKRTTSISRSHYFPCKLDNELNTMEMPIVMYLSGVVYNTSRSLSAY
jgi:hypothetical protein